MGRRFQRIPRDSLKQTRSLESLRRQTPLQTVVTQVLIEAGDAKELAQTSHQVALTQIQKLCKEHGMTSPLLFRTQAEILEKCYHNALSVSKRRRYHEEAKRCITLGYQLSGRKNMAFLSYLGFLMIEDATDTHGYKQAIETLNEAYLISNPIDPLASVLLSVDETQEFTGSFPTYEDRVENARNDIVNLLGFCLLNLKRMGCDVSTIQQILQKLGVKNSDKVKLYWICLGVEEKHRFLQVNNVTSYLISLNKHLAHLVLSQALSFYEAHGKWNFWMCCTCSDTFPTSELHFLHVTTTHLKELTSHLNSFFPALSVHGCDWPLVIKTVRWKPLNTSAAIPMLQHKWKLLASARKTNSKIGKKNRNTPGSSSDAPDPIEGSTSTFELLRYDANPSAKTGIFKWKWPFVNDPKRGSPLCHILKLLNQLLSEKKFLAAHMNILIQRSLSMLDGSLGRLVRDLGLEQTHYPLCLLKVSQLHKIHNLLQEMSDFTAMSFGQQTSLEETLDCGMKALNIDGAISLSNESLYLVLDEKSFQIESTSGNSPPNDDDASAPNHHSSTTQPTSGNKDTVENPVPPWVEAMVSWIYADHSTDESLERWRTLKEERRCRGQEELVTYKGLFTECLTEVHNCQDVLLGKLIPTDALPPKIHKDTDSASQNPQADRFIEAVIQKESEDNDSELTEIDKLTLQVAMDTHQMETKLNHFAAYDYQPIVLSIVKPYLREYAEGIVDTTKESDDAPHSLLESQVENQGSDWVQAAMKRRRYSLKIKQPIGALRHQEEERYDIHKSAWFIDSGASVSCTGNLELFDVVKDLKSPDVMSVANGNIVIAEKKGTVRVVGVRANAPVPTEQEYKVKGVRYVENFESNLLSVSQFTKQHNCMVEMRKNEYVIRDLHPGTWLDIKDPEDIVWLDDDLKFGMYYYKPDEYRRN